MPVLSLPRPSPTTTTTLRLLLRPEASHLPSSPCLSPPPATPFASLLRECRSLRRARSIHGQLLASGALLPSSSTGLVAAYAACGGSADALSALERLCPDSVYCWNLLIKHDACGGRPDGAFSLCVHMRRLGVPPDGFTFPYVLKACGELRAARRGASVHAVVSRNGFESNVFVCNALVAMYARCAAPGQARAIFDEMLLKGIEDVVSWNSMVACHAQNGEPAFALRTFARMCKQCRPDAISLVNVLPACASLRASSQGRQIHASAYKVGLFSDLFVGNAIVDVYAKCGIMSDALKVFEHMEVRDVVSWNAMVTGYSQNGNFDDALSLFEEMNKEKIALNVVTWSAVIAGYAQRGHGHEALGVFRQMQKSGAEPNAITIISLLSACASVGALLQGMEVHAHALRRCVMSSGDDQEGKEEDLMVQNALIDMYSKCKKFDQAHAIFDSVPLRERNVVTWTVMIGGYAQHGDANAALKLFSEMIRQEKAVTPNAFTISCALMAAARLAALRIGKQIHGYVIRNRFEAAMLHVANCLIDMYSKCGDIDAAQNVFSKTLDRNDVSWASLMTGYGVHGRGKDVLRLFEQMQDAGLEPDGVAFLILLYACSHSGMVSEGLHYFHSMASDFGVVAGAEHYACVVDILGRAGRLDEADNLIKEMPVEPTPVVWVALLSACRIHSNVELAEHASQKLTELGYDYDGSYTLLSNIYAKAGRWQDVSRIRGQMRKMGIKKRPGCSWIQGKKGTTTFYVGDRSHPQSPQIYALLATLIQRIKILGYVPETVFALHDVDDEEKSSLLLEHSEKLALAFGILTSPPGAPIRITKNLRVCGDCHSAITFISKIVEHEIIVRDSSRFHHFKEGSCSCGGYW
ncbi:hypothetical protein Taro_019491 [Colocasia esculenta]|uniref:DYW domain-containing protein n=1 Tax=Colocasia esculenta TaxID=4460 RepID=A0A843V5M7_COLES|nr:hypothetical protein [Colocasia esculenta]